MRVQKLLTSFLMSCAISLVGCDRTPPTEEEVGKVTEKNRAAYGTETPSVDPYRREVLIPAGSKYAGFYLDHGYNHAGPHPAWYGVVTRPRHADEPREIFTAYVYGAETTSSQDYSVAVLQTWTITEQ